MKAVVRLLLACTLSVSIAGGLAYLQQTGSSDLGEGGLPVFSQKPKPLSADNVVDKLAPLKLHLSITKVEWREPILAVDLSLKPSETNRDIVFDDLLQLAQLGFGGISNVDHLLVRVLDAGNDEKRLLLTMDARRERFSVRELKTGMGSNPEVKTLLQSHAALTYTAMWKGRFGS